MKNFILLLLLCFTQLSMAQDNVATSLDIFSHSETQLLTWQQIFESRWKSIDKDSNNLLDKSEIQHISPAFLLLSFKYFKDLDTTTMVLFLMKNLKFIVRNKKKNRKKKLIFNGKV